MDVARTAVLLALVACFGLLVASVLYSLPFAVQTLHAALAGVDRLLLEASEVLGRSAWGTTWRVLLPLCRPGLATAAVLTFAHTVGEFGVVLMVGGNIPGGPGPCRCRCTTASRPSTTPPPAARAWRCCCSPWWCSQPCTPFSGPP